MVNIDNAKAQTPDSQAAITSEMALELLKKGNERFLNGQQLERAYDKQIEATTKGQYPFAVVLSCIDSRVPTQIIFDQGIGDLFDACVAGNIVNEDILGSIEYACKFAGVKLIVVMGHTSCGAVKGACDDVNVGNLDPLLSKIKPAINDTETAADEARNSSNIAFVNRVAERNVEVSIENIKSRSAILNEMHEDGSIDIVKAMYDVGSGKVTFWK